MRHHAALTGDRELVMNWIGFGWGLGAAAAAGAILYAIAARKARSIELSASQHPIHDLRVLWRQVSVASTVIAGWSAWIVVYDVHWSHIAVGSGCTAIAGAAVCLVLPASVSRRPIAAAIARARGIDVKATRSLRRLAVQAIRVATLLWPVALALAVTGNLAIRAAILAIACFLLNTIVTGLLAPVTARITGPDAMPADVQERLSVLAAQVGVEIRGRLIRARTRRLATAVQTGWLPGLRYVLVTDYLLDEMSSAGTEAIMAHELAHARHRDGAIRTYLTTVSDFPLALAFVALLAGRTTFALVTFAIAIVPLFGLLYLVRDLAIRQEFAADKMAAATVGPTILAEALRRIVELNSIRQDTSAEYDHKVGHPAIGRRIARLESMAAAAEPAP
jgi:Zn-dependent protease with chaperone function